MTPDGPDPERAASFEVTHEAEATGTLVVGLSQFGLAGLTAVDYLTDHLECDQVGHITAAELPSITPFEGGRPRHHTRLFKPPDRDLTLLVNELFVPVWAADAFANSLLDWVERNAITEVVVLSGVPIPHGPEEHEVFYVATDDYRDHRLADEAVPPMGVGFLDGVNASLMARGMESPLRTGLFITPVHAQAPDVEASLRLLDTFTAVYDLAVDTEPLRQFAAEVENYYQELAQRLETVEERHVPDDRMYM